jgi:DNA mismatch endonuclease, patch repair protein
MVDVHSAKVRSYNMSKIGGKNTKPEIIVRKFLFLKGFRFRLHQANLPGKPDIVLPKYRTVIFVNGCFWHGHKKCKYFVLPKTRATWWEDKILKTQERDKINYKKLKMNGWKVISIFECDLKKPLREKSLNKIVTLLLENI